MEFDNLSNRVLAAALTVHSALGPGLFEEVIRSACGVNLSRQASRSSLNYQCRSSMTDSSWMLVIRQI